MILRMLGRGTVSTSRMHFRRMESTSKFASKEREEMIPQAGPSKGVVNETLSLALIHATKQASSSHDELDQESLLSPPQIDNVLPPGKNTPLYPQLESSIFQTLPEFARTDVEALALLAQLHRRIIAAEAAPAWDAYRAIVMTHPLGSRLLTPPILHCLALIISKSRPRTRTTFLRLLAVISELRNMGATVLLSEWNALVHCAGSGFRKVREEDYDTAMGVLKDGLSVSEDRTNSSFSGRDSLDVVTLNSLLTIAAHTRSENIMQRALDMFQSRPDIVPNRITLLTLLNFHAMMGQVDHIPSILTRMIENDMRVGIDGLNIALWAYARAGYLNVAMPVYYILRRNGFRPDAPALNVSTPTQNFYGNDATPNPILAVPGIEAWLGLRPDLIMYRALIQCLTYHGDLMGAIMVFRDMMSARPGEDPETRVGRRRPSPESYSASVDVYRSIFIGFTRHGAAPVVEDRVSDPLDSLRKFGMRTWAARRSPRRVARSVVPLSNPNPNPNPNPTAVRSAWTEENLTALFDNFLNVPIYPSEQQQHGSVEDRPRPLVKPSIVYWALVAYARTTNDDPRSMYGAWRKMADVFGFGTQPDSRWRVRGRLKTLVEWLERQHQLEQRNF